jgi:hypothetical protein
MKAAASVRQSRAPRLAGRLQLPNARAKRDVPDAASVPCLEFADALFEVGDVLRFGQVALVALTLRLQRWQKPFEELQEARHGQSFLCEALHCSHPMNGEY